MTKKQKLAELIRNYAHAQAAVAAYNVRCSREATTNGVHTDAYREFCNCSDYWMKCEDVYRNILKDEHGLVV